MSAQYDSSFYQQQLAGSLVSARALLPILFKYYTPKSIVDVGCGVGTWLKAAMDLGIADVLGLDGEYVDRNLLQIPESSFRATDLRRRVTADQRFDLAMCLEVAEHLPFHRAETFVRDLVALSDVVLFSAAIPYQGGMDHINEQWLEFWAILFQRYGYVPCDFLRRQYWGDPSVDFWYSQNLIVFCTSKHAADTFPREFLAAGRPLSYPHPLTFLVNAARYRPLSAKALDLECEGYNNLLQAYQEGDGTLPLLRIADATDENGELLFPRSRMLITDAQAEISRRDSDIARLTDELRIARSETAQETQRPAEWELGIARLTAELGAARSDAAQQMEALETVRQQNDRTLAELAGVRSQADRLLEELIRKSAQAQRLESEVDERRNQVRDLSSEIERLSNDFSTQSFEIRNLVRQVTAHESENTRLKEEIRARREESSRLSLALGVQVGEMRRRSEQLAGKDIALREATERSDARARELAVLRNSLTWRITSRILHWMRRLAGAGPQGRRTVRVLRSSGMFDQEYYLAQNPDVAESGVDPIQHYVRSGAAEGRNPSPHFGTSAYTETHPEVAILGINPLLHYVLYGNSDGPSNGSAGSDGSGR